MPLLILFVALPIIEMMVILKVASYVGGWTTVGLVLLTAFIGMTLLRAQGLSTLAEAQRKTQAGEMPIKEMVDGIFLAVGGALLLTPGFVTDTIGFCCLLPGIRHIIIGRLMERLLRSAQFSVFTSQSYSQGRPHSSADGDIIDGEFHRFDDSDPTDRRIR